MLKPPSLSSNVIRLKSVNSTNKYLIDMASKTEPPEGLVVISDYQSDGRGQIGRYWHSKDGENLLASIILYPRFLKVSDQFVLSKMVSKVLTSLLEDFNIDDVKVKWPNDVYVCDRKICGILIQNQILGKRIKSSVIGVGLNVNQVKWPAEIPNPISMRQILGKSIDLNQVVARMRHHFNTFYNELVFRGKESFDIFYANNLYLKGVESKFLDITGKEFSGKIVGINPEGKLVVRSEGVDLFFAFREVRLNNSSYN